METFRHTTGVYAAAGVTDFVVHSPRPSEPYSGDVATFEGIVSDVARRRVHDLLGSNS